MLYPHTLIQLEVSWFVDGMRSVGFWPSMNSAEHTVLLLPVRIDSSTSNGVDLGSASLALE